MLSRFFKNAGKVRVAAFILTVIWMTVIFAFSDQDADESGAVSRSVSYRMVEASASLFNLDWADEKIQEVADSIENAVRKAAHMTEYAILALFAGTALDAWEWWSPGTHRGGTAALMRHAANVLLCTVYAATDEWHQTFVYGRNGCVKDVFIDGAGALAAVLIIILITNVIKRKRKNGPDSIGSPAE